MIPSTKNFFGNRLKLARKLAGISLQELADMLENRISKQALNKYEMGLMNPSTEVLLALSKILKVKSDFFLKQDQVELGEILFRKKTSLPKKQEEAIIEKARGYVERYLEIEGILAIENRFENPIKDILIANKEDVENAAKVIREKWEIGNNPIPNLVEMLELKGIRVLLVEENDGFDGLATFTSNGLPVVVINIANKSVERIRFTIIHELAHLLLNLTNSVQQDLKNVEKLCHYFSSCFLLPTNMLLKMIGNPKRSYIAINELISIKEYFGISIRAVVHRLKEVDVITESYYQRWVVYMSKTYGQKEEPGKYKGIEKSTVFEQMINRALAEGIISMSKAAALSNCSIDKIRKGLNGIS